jgi:hypothetical protein
MTADLDITISIISTGVAGGGEYLVELREGTKTIAQTQARIDRQALLQHEHAFSARDYGMALYDALFTGQVGREYQRLVGRAGADTVVRVQLVISEYARELHALPWERLFHVFGDVEQPLAASAQTPFSRFLVTGAGDQEAVTETALRLLVAVANPVNLPQGFGAVDVAGEVTALADLLAEQRGRVVGTVLAGCSGLPAALRQRLEQEGWRVVDDVTSWGNIQRLLPGQHVLHILAHGQFVKSDGQAYLLLEDEGGDEAQRGSLQRVADQAIIGVLAGVHPLPQLIFLAACESAKRPEHSANPFVGLAPKLVELGVPAVVAMQDLIPVDLAHALSQDFYRWLLAHGQVDRALNEARALIYQREEFDWAIPVLFLRLKGGQLLRSGRNAVDLMQLARTKLHEGDYEAALRACEAAFSDHGAGEPEAHLLTAVALMGGIGADKLKESTFRQVERSLEIAAMSKTPGIAAAAWAIWGIARFDYYFLNGRPVGTPSLEAMRNKLSELRQSTVDEPLLRQIRASRSAKRYFGLHADGGS